MNRSTPGLPVHHQLLEFTQTHVHRVSDAIQPSHPLSSPSPPAFNLSIQKTKIIASGPITSWKIDGETMETVRDFSFGGSKITAVVDCSHETKRHVLLGRKVMTNLDSILKSRDIALPTKFHAVKAMVFPVVMLDVRVGP